MCMLKTKTRTDETAKRLEETGEIVAYKVVAKSSNKLFAPYSPERTFLIDNEEAAPFEYKPGENKSNRTDTSEDFTVGQPLNIHAHTEALLDGEGFLHVVYGIHVFLKRSDAEMANEQDHERHEKHFKIIKVHCKKEDFVGAGYWDCTVISTAVFTKVSITQKDYDEAIRKGQTA